MSIPTLAELREWANLSPTSVPDDMLQLALDSELALQVSYLRHPVTEAGEPDYASWPAALSAALLRRVARHLASRAVPLGVVADGEYGAVRLASFDAEVERREAPYRRVVFG